MKIAIIGNGIIGNIALKYLSKKGYQIEIISPSSSFAFNFLESKSKKKLKRNDFTIDKDLVISPKFLREDIANCCNLSHKIFRTKSINFFPLELVCDMGLAKYWGANLACDALEDEIEKLCLTKSEKNFLKASLPILDVQEYYEKNYKNDISRIHVNEYIDSCKNNKYEIKSAKLAIWEDKCDMNKLPGFNYSSAIYGSDYINKNLGKRIYGLVTKIQIETENKKKYVSVYFKDEKNISQTKKYDFVFLAAGALGSYRIISNSFRSPKKYFFKERLKHHLILTTICFMPKLPYPEKHFGSGNFNLLLNINNIDCYLNFIPLQSSLEAILINKRINSLIKKISLYLLRKCSKTSQVCFLPNWFLKRLYVVNINIPSKFTNSFIYRKGKKIVIIGGKKKYFKKIILKNFWNYLLKELLKKGIYNLFFRPKVVTNGADLHYSSSLTSYTNRNGRLKINRKVEESIIVLDSSSSKILPTPNPTFYFIARSLLLMRQFVYDNKNF